MAGSSMGSLISLYGNEYVCILLPAITYIINFRCARRENNNLARIESHQPAAALQTP